MMLAGFVDSKCNFKWPCIQIESWHCTIHNGPHENFAYQLWNTKLAYEFILQGNKMELSKLNTSKPEKTAILIMK